MRVTTLYDAFADAPFTTDTFVPYSDVIALQIDNQEDIPLTMLLEAKVDDSMTCGALLDDSGTQRQVTVSAGSNATISFKGIPPMSHIRVFCDASTALSGTVTIKALA